MLGLPKSTEISKPLPKKAIFEKFKPKPDDRRLFDDQINRLSITAEISPHTVSVAVGADVAAVFVILVALKTPECDKKNVALLSKLIDQRIVFVLRYEDTERLAVCREERVLISERRPLDEWRLNLAGLDLGAIWENIIAEIGCIDIPDGKSLDDALAAGERRCKLVKQIAALEKKAMKERQPRRKWKYTDNIKELKRELEVFSNGETGDANPKPC